MTGLVLKLSPKERLLINGAVIENGSRRSRISVVTPRASILRLKDAMHPNDAKTPLRRVCYIAQLVLSGDISTEEARPQISTGIQQLKLVLTGAPCIENLDQALNAAAVDQYYHCLKYLRRMIPIEDALLSGRMQ